MSNHDDAFEAFAQELIERLSNHPDVPPSVRSHDGLTLSIGNCKANLLSLYRTYALQTAELKVHQMQSLVNCLARGGYGGDEDETFADVKAHLRPKLWPRTVVSINGFEIPFSLVGEHLVLTIVYDTPDSIASVPWSRFNKWGVAFHDALRMAFENVDVASSYMGVERNGETPGHCSDATHDNYGSVRFLTEKPYSIFDIGYPRWAFPAARDACAMCQADQPEHIEFNVDLTLAMADDDPKPLPPFPLVDYGQGWQNWQAEPGSAVAAMLAPRQLKYLLDIYAEQTEYLRSTPDERNDFALVESLTANPVNGSDDVPKSVTKWWTSTECLLPTADFIVFPDDHRLKFAWDDVMKVCGDRLAPAEALYPPRWRTTGAPTSAELEELQKMALE